MKLQQYIEASLQGESKAIIDSFPVKMSDAQKRTASCVLGFVRSQAMATLKNNTDFDWADFDEFCEYMSELVDSREKREGSTTTGVSHEGVYKKHNIEWMLKIFQESLGKHEKHILTTELVALFYDVAEKGESLCVAEIASKKPHLYKRLVKFLRISPENGISEWKKLRFLLPEDMRSAFVLEKFTEEQIEKSIQDLIKDRDLEKIIVDHGNYPRKMAFLLRWLHPDLSEEQVNLIA